MRSARIIRWLLRDPTGLLITLLVGTNLMVELATHAAESIVVDLALAPEGALEVIVTVLLTPVAFFVGELFPKDLFRRRPHALVGGAAVGTLAAHVLFLPLTLPLRGVSWLVERALSVPGDELERARGREAVLDLLEGEMRRAEVDPRAEALARNVLRLQAIPVSTVMTRWEDVERIPSSLVGEEARVRVARSPKSRLPVVEEDGRVARYVHQLDVLAVPGPTGEPGGEPEEPRIDELARALVVIPPDLAVDRALSRLRTAGQRLALVAEEGRPLGLVSLKDLLEEISGELAAW